PALRLMLAQGAAQARMPRRCRQANRALAGKQCEVAGTHGVPEGTAMVAQRDGDAAGVAAAGGWRELPAQHLQRLLLAHGVAAHVLRRGNFELTRARGVERVPEVV